MKEGPRAEYKKLLAGGEATADPGQRHVVEQLQHLHDALLVHEVGRGHNFEALKKGWRRWFSATKGSAGETGPRGIYIYGGVGRGKSMLMDLFFDHAPPQRKRRVHFHEFLQEVHSAVHDWRQLSAEQQKAHPDAGEDPTDPLAPVARQIARESTLLCFDEFQVGDVADAMILSRLFSALFELGVVVVATSNRAPDELYENGLNRGLFLPFIELVKDRLDICELDGPVDYRLNQLTGHPVYFSPLGGVAEAELDDAFHRLAAGTPGERHVIELKGRTLEVPKAAHGVARFCFADLCGKPLGAADYLALAWRYHTLVLDRVPALGPENRNEAKRFVILIDALYENRVKLICSAESPPHDLYLAGDGSFEFQRTISRLMEMQSRDYLAAGHAV